MEPTQVAHRGSVRFRHAGANAAEVEVELDYEPPAGAVGRWLARRFGEEPEQQVSDDLRRLKELMESSTTSSSQS